MQRSLAEVSDYHTPKVTKHIDFTMRQIRTDTTPGANVAANARTFSPTEFARINPKRTQMLERASLRRRTWRRPWRQRRQFKRR
jgi:hypothetical protein